jgi:hypothetical protein
MNPKAQWACPWSRMRLGDLPGPQSGLARHGSEGYFQRRWRQLAAHRFRC